MLRKIAPCCSRHPPPEKIDEERSAYERGHCANWKLGWGYNGARERVCDNHRDGTAERSGGKQGAMVGTEKQTHHVRHKQADVADGTADGNSEAGEYRRSDVDHEAHAPNIDAEMHGFFFACKEQVQIRGGSVDRTGGDQEANAEDPTQAGLKRTGKVAHEPKRHAAEIASGESGQQKHDDGGEERRADDAGEEQSGAIDLSFAATK